MPHGKTTYVLGAGASKDAGYPLASCMGRELSQWMETCGEHDETLLWMRDRFEDPHDMERVLTTMDDIVARNERSAESALIGNVYKPAITQSLRAWFLEIREKQEGSYRSFASQVIKPGDTVISFNYDDSLDRQLKSSGHWSLGDGYGFPVEGFEIGSSVQLLKLHGSINWFAALFNGIRGGVVNLDNALGSRPVFVEPDTLFLGYQEADPRTPKTFGFVQPLILPTERKKFYFETSLGLQWKEFGMFFGIELRNIYTTARKSFCVGTAWSQSMKERIACCWKRSLRQLSSRFVAVVTQNASLMNFGPLAGLHMPPNQFSSGIG